MIFWCFVARYCLCCIYSQKYRIFKLVGTRWRQVSSNFNNSFIVMENLFFDMYKNYANGVRFLLIMVKFLPFLTWHVPLKNHWSFIDLLFFVFLSQEMILSLVFTEVRSVLCTAFIGYIKLAITFSFPQDSWKLNYLFKSVSLLISFVQRSHFLPLG